MPKKDRNTVETEREQRTAGCPVDELFTAEAMDRTVRNELLCAPEDYGGGIGDPYVGWWSNSWVNSPAMSGEAMQDGRVGADRLDWDQAEQAEQDVQDAEDALEAGGKDFPAPSSKV